MLDIQVSISSFKVKVYIRNYLDILVYRPPKLKISGLLHNKGVMKQVTFKSLNFHDRYLLFSIRGGTEVLKLDYDEIEFIQLPLISGNDFDHSSSPIQSGYTIADAIKKEEKEPKTEDPKLKESHAITPSSHSIFSEKSPSEEPFPQKPQHITNQHKP